MRYDYGPGGRLTRVADNTGREVVTGFRYDAAGQLQAMRFGNGVRSSFGYDALQRMNAVVATAGDGTTVQRLAYQFDPASNISSIVDAVTGNTQVFEYDALDRLTRAVSTTYGERRYAYDAGGNLLRKGDLFFGTDPEHPQRVTCVVDTTPDRKVRLATPAGNCPATVLKRPAEPAPRVFAVGYDGRGNVTQKGDQRYEYDDQNHLIRNRDGKGNIIEANAYDASGELVEKQTGHLSTTFIDGIYEEVRGPGRNTVTARHHVYAGPLLVATFETVRHGRAVAASNEAGGGGGLAAAGSAARLSRPRLTKAVAAAGLAVGCSRSPASSWPPVASGCGQRTGAEPRCAWSRTRFRPNRCKRTGGWRSQPSR